MPLASFIIRNIEAILAEWEAFARRIWPAGMASDPAELRDHAGDILRATALDMATVQTETERSEKSMGDGAAGVDSRRLDGASNQHGAGRVDSGFGLKELVSEYRALRASVIRLWRASEPNPDLHDLDDLTRFNESIDQSLAKAVNSYAERIDRSRQMFLAILGHDLRNPLNAMSMAAEAIRHDRQTDPESVESAGQIVASAEAMARMISDLLDFTTAGLGGGMGVTRAPADMGNICRAVIDETRAGHPNCHVTLKTDGGNLTGEWDAARLRQLVSNLLGNAVQHGSDACGVTLTLNGNDADEIVLAVHNEGPPIPQDALATIFDPLVRICSPEPQRRHRPGSIGLGLYITRQVATAHGGDVTVESTIDAGTTFTLRLPRRRSIYTGQPTLDEKARRQVVSSH